MSFPRSTSGCESYGASVLLCYATPSCQPRQMTLIQSRARIRTAPVLLSPLLLSPRGVSFAAGDGLVVDVDGQGLA
jgi:hypothetical protein